MPPSDSGEQADDLKLERLRDLAAHCRNDLAEYKLPAGFHFLETFPLGVTGKVDKKALKALWAEKLKTHVS